MRDAAVSVKDKGGIVSTDTNDSLLGYMYSYDDGNND